MGTKSPVTKKAVEAIEARKECSQKLGELIEKIQDYEDSNCGKYELSKLDLLVIEHALTYRKDQNNEEIKKIEKALACGSESGDLSSQSEKNILQGCVRLLYEAGEFFREYLNCIGAEPDEEYPLIFPMQYGHIVKHLFLWNTHHSGGTSTRAKCRELGVNFDDTVDICEDDEDDCETGD